MEFLSTLSQRFLTIWQDLCNIILRPCTSAVDLVVLAVTWMSNSPHVADLIKYVFLGSIMECGRTLNQTALEWMQQLFVVEASFVNGDFAYDWVTRYLADQKTWSRSRIFRVVVQNPINAHASAETFPTGPDLKSDGIPKQLYQPIPGSDNPVFIHWKWHWISVSMSKVPPTQAWVAATSEGQTITLRVWSRNRRILDEFVEEARRHFFLSSQPPPELPNVPHQSDTIITARFKQGDRSYNWMLTWIKAHDTFEETTHLDVTTTQSELAADPETGEKRLLAYRPAKGSKRRVRWQGHWFQFDVHEDGEPKDNYSPPTFYPGSRGKSAIGVINVTVHSRNRDIMTSLIEAAYEEYGRSTISKVTVHLPSANGPYGAMWETTVTRSGRQLDTVILPEGVLDSLLKDVVKFLENEDWYARGGVPYRRGYLLYGEPGTGKSSTIQAIASEVGLEIYYIQLASRNLGDEGLRRLFSEAPTRCIILLEDIDCAFPASRKEESDDMDDMMMSPYGHRLTFSGLLNCLDSVVSEEGRIVFATTNHIEKLDPALIRPGRMDLKIEFKLATHYQLRQTFHRIAQTMASNEGSGTEAESGGESASQAAHFEQLATQFADLVPEGKYSLAQIQGFLIPRRDELGTAIDEVAAWMQEQDNEKNRIDEMRKQAKELREASKRKASRGDGFVDIAPPDTSPTSLPVTSPELGHETITAKHCCHCTCKLSDAKSNRVQGPSSTPPEVDQLDKSKSSSDGKEGDLMTGMESEGGGTSSSNTV